MDVLDKNGLSIKVDVTVRFKPVANKIGDLHERFNGEYIQVLVRHLTQRGIGVLITDHNVRETLGLIDRAYIIHSGEVLTEGRPDDIVANPEVRRVYLGEQFRL